MPFSENNEVTARGRKFFLFCLSCQSGAELVVKAKNKCNLTQNPATLLWVIIRQCEKWKMR